MRAILIDPFKCELSEVEVPDFIPGTDSGLSQLQAIYKLLDCEVVQQATLENSNVNGALIVDENGKLGIKPEQRYFEHTLFPHDYLAGKALWIGYKNGDWKPIGLSLDHCQTFVNFLPFKFLHI